MVANGHAKDRISADRFSRHVPCSGCRHSRSAHVGGGCLCVVLEPGQVADTDTMIAPCTKRLARFKVPHYAIVIREEDISVTAAGPPQKFSLAKLAADLVSAQAAKTRRTLQNRYSRADIPTRLSNRRRPTTSQGSGGINIRNQRRPACACMSRARPTTARVPRGR